MTDEMPPEGTEPPTPNLRALATQADFAAVDIEAPIRDLRLADPHEMFTPYQRAFAAAMEAETEPTQVVYRLLSVLCSIALQPSDRGSRWGPMMTREASRSAIPEDFRGEQTATISAIVGRVGNSGLRARMADIAWSNNRKDGRSAAVAVDAYCDTVTGLLDGSLITSHGRAELQEALTFLHRAMQIAKDSTARNKRPPKVAQTFEAMHAAACTAKDIWSFVSITDLGLDYGLRQPAIAARELEALARTIPAWNLSNGGEAGVGPSSAPVSQFE